MILVLRRRVAVMILVLAVVAGAVGIVRILYPLQHGDRILAEASRHQLDPYLVAAIIYVESGFDRKGLSPKGARGLMQIMPETGAWIAQRMGRENFDPDQLYDADTNIALGCWYLADLRREFAGREELVLAAYNGGRGNVRQWVSDAGLGDADQETAIQRIPFPETRAFVRKVLRSRELYRLLYPFWGRA